METSNPNRRVLTENLQDVPLTAASYVGFRTVAPATPSIKLRLGGFSRPGQQSSLLESPSPNDSPSFLACALSRKGREQNLSLEDEYDGLKALISLGEEKGYLLYDEVNEALSEERLGSEDLDRILHFLGAAGSGSDPPFSRCCWN